MSGSELSIVRPRAWSMRTEIRGGDDMMAVLSGAKSFGRKAVATVGDRTFVLSTGGKRALTTRMRESGRMDDAVVMKHTAAAKGEIAIGDAAYELSRLPDGRWQIVSKERGPVMTIVRDAKDPSQGRAVMELQDDNALTLVLVSWFALRTMEY